MYLNSIFQNNISVFRFTFSLKALDLFLSLSFTFCHFSISRKIIGQTIKNELDLNGISIDMFYEDMVSFDPRGQRSTPPNGKKALVVVITKMLLL